MSDLRYPIGTFEHQGSITSTDLDIWIGQIEALPGQMREAVSGLSDAQLDTPYRPGGWSIRQVVHHVPDSHLNCYVRFKLALTEDKPLIKPYFEDRWAELPDYRVVPVETSLEFLELLHRKWVALLRDDAPQVVEEPDEEERGEQGGRGEGPALGLARQRVDGVRLPGADAGEHRGARPDRQHQRRDHLLPEQRGSHRLVVRLRRDVAAQGGVGGQLLLPGRPCQVHRGQRPARP